MKKRDKMTSKILIMLVLAVTGLQAAAQNNSKPTSKKAVSENKSEHPAPKNADADMVSKEESETEESAVGTLKNHGKEIRKVIKSETGVIRGYDFGTPKQKIKDTEDALYVADGKNFMIYQVNVNENEKAEIIYYLDENENVKGFGIAFLVSADQMAANVEETLIDDFQAYFNERYGKFTNNSRNDEVWTSKDGSYTVEMGDSSEDASMLEIEIEIFKK